MPDVATEELRRLLIDAIQIMLGARPSTRSHVVVGEDLLQLFLGFDGIWGEAREPVHHGQSEHYEEIVRHNAGISSGAAYDGGISL
jgi:hypothetical protein